MILVPASKPPLSLVAGVLVGAALFGGVIAWAIKGNRADLAAVQRASLAACKDSLEPGGVRYFLAQQGYRQIHQTLATPREFFPDIPPETFDKLIAKSVARQRQEIQEVLDANCEARYKS